ncbi:MAG: Crp/Fnr family transcriptional regulator [Clostridia bacterium]|nr:Crp/Fnr family transcriptional regulator [Clostridia bacterium]
MSISDFYKEYFPFWGVLSDEDRALLCDNTDEEHFEKEQPLHDNMACSGLFIVKSGRLRIYILSEEGKEITLYRLSPGDICMLSASCVIQSITFDVYVDAELPSDCYRISSSAFGSLSERVPQVKIFGLETAVERFSDVMWVMQQIVFMSMDKRIAIFLLEESVATGSDTVTVTHEMIARHLGTAREVVTRVLKHLSLDGVVEVTRKGIVITDKKRLGSIAY